MSDKVFICQITNTYVYIHHPNISFYPLTNCVSVLPPIHTSLPSCIVPPYTSSVKQWSLQDNQLDLPFIRRHQIYNKFNMNM